MQPPAPLPTPRAGLLKAALLTPFLTPLLTPLLALPLLAPVPARAEPAAALDRVGVWLGGFRTSFDGSLQLRNADGSLDTGEQPLFSGHDVVQRARIDWLLGDRQGFTVDYFRLHRQQSRELSTSFTVQGTTYAPNAQLSTDVLADFGHIDYRWWFGSGDAVLGLGVGAGYYRLALDLQAQATAGNSSAAGRFQSDDHAWAPVLSLGGRWRVAEGVRLYADVSGVEFRNSNSRTQLAAGAISSAGAGTPPARACRS